MALALLLIAGSAMAPAAVPKFLVQVGEGGAGAGQIENARGVATDPDTGQLYVADLSTPRVEEFTPWGEFVKAFGWDVAPGAVDEEQEVWLRATAGQFRLTFGASTTSDLPFDADAEEVEAALNALPSVSSGGGSVTVEGGPGGIAGTTPSVYIVRFGGSLAGTDVAELAASNGAAPLSGGAPNTLLEVRTRANGTPGGTGFEACTAASGCKKGVAGVGAGQFTAPSGIAVDSSGHVYVFERQNLRLQKFTSAGEFVYMVGKGVDKTDKGNICTRAQLEGGDVCGAGVAGTGNGEFSVQSVIGVAGDYVDISPTGTVYVGDKDRIQAFEPDGAFLGQISFASVNAKDSRLPASGNPGALAVDPVSGDVYFAFAQGVLEQEKVHGVYRLDEAGELVDVLEAVGPKAPGNFDSPESLATDSEGNVFLALFPFVNQAQQPHRVMEFDPAGDILIPFSEGFNSTSTQLPGLAVNSAGDVLVANGAAGFVNVYGPAPLELEPPPRVPPTIVDQFATSVKLTEAVVKAKINPHLWADTTYYVEYGTGSCPGACTKAPLSPVLLTDEIVDAAITTEGISLAGLSANTTYHYRFVAEGGGGGPVFGSERTFTTGKEAGPPPSCPENEAFRTGASALLPDCRAYEMVSPVDKGGADIVTLCQLLCYPSALNQSAPDANLFTYSAYRAFAEPRSAPFSSQYLAARTTSGWSTTSITPPQEGPPEFGDASDGDTMFKAFTPDLEKALVLQSRGPALSPGSEFPNVYLRDNVAGTYSPLVSGQALAGLPNPAFPEVQGLTPDGRCGIFRAKDKLVDEAKEGLTQLYESCEGVLSLVSILPDDTASSQPSSAGTPGTTSQNRSGSLFHAISEDGNRVFWSEASSGPGSLYLRLVSAGKTIVLSTPRARFTGASSDGTRAFFVPIEGPDLGELIEATIDGAGNLTTSSVAAEVEGVMGMSDDATRVYFVSRQDLDGGGAAQAGQANLYLHESGGEELVATLAAKDVSGANVSVVADEPIRRTSRVTPDGLHVAFMSLAPLTGYDNLDAETGEPDAEVFLYDAGADELICASCNPTGARPTGREILAAESDKPAGISAAAHIPTFESQLYGSRVLADDGNRLFFQSFEALAPADENGLQDVYQWEPSGVGTCSEDDASYQSQSGGCVEMISSGDATRDATFVDADADGSDVFFATNASLLAQDKGLVDIYDARVDGGFPQVTVPEGCEGEACQPEVPAPVTSAPGSTSSGPGNPPPSPRKPRCPKGKLRAKRGSKVRCVPNRHKQHHRKNGPARKSRRAEG